MQLNRVTSPKLHQVLSCTDDCARTGAVVRDHLAAGRNLIKDKPSERRYAFVCSANGTRANARPSKSQIYKCFL